MAIDPSELDEFANRFDKLSPQQRDKLLEILEQRRIALAAAPPGRTALDGFKERGLLGSIKDAPADLSTNPAYLEGFGEDAQRSDPS